MKREYDCVIVGGGPSGMAAGIALKELGVADILVLDRNRRLGGILNQCIHPGFGLLRYDRDLTGPEYARALEDEFVAAGVECALGAMVLDISALKTLKVISPLEGFAEIHARSVIVATGCRERTRENLEIAGSRPTGIYTAGQAQNLINLKGYKLGRRALIQGSGDIGLIMARRLTIEGYEVVAVLERLPYLSGLVRNKVQCLDHFDIPLRFGTQICEIVGKKRVEGVFVEKLDAGQRPLEGSREYFPCDTVLFSVGLIPEVDIVKGAGLSIARNGSVDVNSGFEADDSGIFLCGNALHIHDLADNAAKEGEIVARQVARFLRAPEQYRATVHQSLPYKPLQAITRYDAAFFGRLEASGQKVCIVCPKGCAISADAATCPRGKEYFAASEKGRFQTLTTTIGAFGKGGRSRLAIKSKGSVNVTETAALRRGIALAAVSAPGIGSSSTRSSPGASPSEMEFSVTVSGRDVPFSVCG